MKNYYELIPGDAKQYQLIPDDSDHYRLLPGPPSKVYDLIPSKVSQYTLLERRDRELLRRQRSEMRQVTEVSKSAMDQLSILYLYIEYRLVRALAATEAIQLQHGLAEESAHVMGSVHTFLTERFLQRVLTLFEAKSNTILAHLAPDVPFMKGDDRDELHRD